LDATKEIIEWLKNNPNATEEEINEKIRELQNKTRPIIERAEARRELDDLIKNLRNKSKNDEIIQKLSESDKKLVKNGLDDCENWLSKNYDSPMKELIKKREELEGNVKSVIDKAEQLVEIDKYTNSLKKKSE